MVLSWKNVSISKKLYFVVGIMASLIVVELLVLRFAMENLSAVRAFVGGEGLWTKGQKQAIYQLQRYALTRDEADYRAFEEALKVNDGDHMARMELLKPKPDMAVVRAGFIQGQIHPDDIDSMVRLLQRFYFISYISKAIGAWTEGDVLIDELRVTAADYHKLISSGKNDYATLREVTERIHALNARLSHVTAEFSLVLGQGSRWLENLVLMILFALVLTVESVGLTLAVMTSRDLSRGLRDLIGVANQIGKGNFDQRLEVRSGDEIGQLTVAVNNMGALLQNSYGELEEKVKARTQELVGAVKVRDQFLSVASHELKTPLTTLKLQTQMRARNISKSDPDFFPLEKLKQMFDDDHRQINRLIRLVDDMLDIARISSGRFVLECEECDLTKIVLDVVSRFAQQFEAAGMSVSVEATESVTGTWDPYRLEQVITNLLTNAIKYGPGKPVEISVRKIDNKARLMVRDHGIGIAPEDQARIFQQFERAVSANLATGLGLGLYIAKEIVDAHDGKFWVESQLNAGSTFFVELNT